MLGQQASCQLGQLGRQAFLLVCWPLLVWQELAWAALGRKVVVWFKMRLLYMSSLCTSYNKYGFIMNHRFMNNFFHSGIIHSVKHKMLTAIFTNLFHNKQRLIYQPLKMNENFTESEFRHMPRTNKNIFKKWFERAS